MCRHVCVYECVCMRQRQKECVRDRDNDVLGRMGLSLGVIHHNETAEGQSHQSVSTTTLHWNTDDKHTNRWRPEENQMWRQAGLTCRCQNGVLKEGREDRVLMKPIEWTNDECEGRQVGGERFRTNSLPVSDNDASHDVKSWRCVHPLATFWE